MPPFPGDADVDIVYVSGPISKTPDEFAHATSASAAVMIRVVFMGFIGVQRRVSCIQVLGRPATLDSEA